MPNDSSDMNNDDDQQQSGITGGQKLILGAIAVVFGVLLILWFSNYVFDRPIFGFGEIEYFGRQAPPTAAEAPMTWTIVPQFAPLAVKHEIAPPAQAAEIRRGERLEAGENADLYRVSWLSDSQTVYGVLGVPHGEEAVPAMVVAHPSDSPYHTGLHTDNTVLWLAEQGILAFAPDYRGWGNSEGDRGNEVRDIWNAVETLRNDSRVAEGRIGLMGFSMGGGIVARAAVTMPNLPLLVLYYPQLNGSNEQLESVVRYNDPGVGSGRVLQILNAMRGANTDLREAVYVLRMISPIYHLDEFGGHVAIFHGENDNIVSVRQSESLERELRGAGVSVSLEVYPNQSHAFANAIDNVSREDLQQVMGQHLK